jgi:hypothetical protein
LQVSRDQRPDCFELHSRDKPPEWIGMGVNPAWYLSPSPEGMATNP